MKLYILIAFAVTAFAASDLPEQCQLPAHPGFCKMLLLRWWYNAEKGQCEEFFFGGCSGNANNFETKELCEHTCSVHARASSIPERCKLPAHPGFCRMPLLRWWYNAETGQCEEFYFGGCAGNANNFDTKELCENTCSEESTNLTPLQPVLAYRGLTKKMLPASRPNGWPICRRPPYSGPCKAAFTRFYYDAATNTCRQFTYGGCKSNGNNFVSGTACMKACASSIPVSPRPEIAARCRHLSTCAHLIALKKATYWTKKNREKVQGHESSSHHFRVLGPSLERPKTWFLDLGHSKNLFASGHHTVALVELTSLASTTTLRPTLAESLCMEDARAMEITLSLTMTAWLLAHFNASEAGATLAMCEQLAFIQ
ncbi:actinia tenebrosa protease inhibitors isoform X2 [Rhipicephalus microplus]|uniref:actinia tenebrosa protease inhibitors isoform X2 n=1 Tax=Rhipicephalus microplus TaxID=6941 RepID=UPI003F6BD839